jgi:mono/diheme cytochrome c family protein
VVSGGWNLESKNLTMEKNMFRTKPRKSLTYNSAILAVFAACLTLIPILPSSTNAAQDSAATAATFKTKCALCHGPDGSGSEVGKSMNVPDFRSDAVQKLSDAELAQTVSDGKGGMPSFKGSLTADQIHTSVKHIRTLAAKK